MKAQLLDRVPHKQRGFRRGFRGWWWVSASTLIAVDGADFDGTNDYMTRGAGLTGASDSKSGIISLRMKINGGDGMNMYLGMGDTLLGGGSGRVHFRRVFTNVFRFDLQQSDGVTSATIQSVGTYTASATWMHLLASWDVATLGAHHLYINDVSDISVTEFNNATIDYTMANWSVGAQVNAAEKSNISFAEYYFAPGQYLDFSIVANRRKFISPSGKPVHLGADGSLPTGVAPIMYHHLDDGEAVANFATNRGTGGNFTITGALATASTSPSD